MLGLGAISKKIFGTANDRKVRTATKQVAAINALEPEISALSDEDLKARTEAFRARVAGGETLDQLLPEAFAVVREAAKRAIGLRPFDVQLVGGIMLHEGRISEMKTGEGKTLVATLPTYLNALEGKGVHVVTVNDYLAKRDAEWMGKVYGFLGLTTGVVVPGVDDRARKAAYACDVTYATNNELGFDYLRDNMKYRLEDMVQRGHRYAIVDEVDSILIDEARTPLIISGPTEDQSQLYIEIDKIIPQLDETHYEIDEKARQTALTEEGNEAVEQALREAGYLEGEATLYDPENVTYVHHVNQALRAHKLFTLDKDYIVKGGKVVIIDEFTGRMMDGRRWGDGLHQAVEAKEDQPIQPENVTLASVTFQNYFRLYRKLGGMTGTAMTEAEEFGSIYGLDVVEIPTNKPVQRADDDDQVFRTGREKFAAIAEAIKDGVARGQPMLVGTTSIEKSEALSELLKAADVPHQVLNARHHEQEAQIVAQAGHPGAVTIATNMAGRGTDIQLGGNYEMAARRAIAERFTPDIQKVAQEAAQAVLENQPPLEDERQAQARANFIVQLIGQQAATQEMARLMKEAEDGLHEDVVGPIKAEIAAAKQKALDAGGLWVIATERHESRRIDNQLRGRSGRQGDPGRSTFYLSLEDDLMRIFGSERMESVLSKLGLEEGEAIVHTWVNKAIERAQGKVEARNFDIRKNLLKFDDVMNEQRKAVFGQRREIMDAEDVAEIVGDMRETLVDDLVSRHIPERAYADQWDVEGLAEEVERFFGVALPVAEWADEEGVDDEAIRERLNRAGEEIMARKVAKYGRDVMRQQEKGVVLQTIDQHWREHLVTLDHLRSVIGLRGYAQRDPLNEYKSEAFQLFESLLTRLRGEVTAALARFEVAEAPAAPAPGPEASPSARPAPTAAAAAAAAASAAGGVGVAVTDRPAVADVNPDDPESWGKVGRNDACPCGSGRKYKHCHGRHG